MKYLFPIIHLILLAIAAYCSVQVMYKKIGIDSSAYISMPISESSFEISKDRQTDGVNNRLFYESILKRNLFDVLVTKKPVASNGADSEKKEVLEEPQKTKLQLTLWGTAIGLSDVYAVIEDKKNRTQLLLKKGEKIGDATILDIQRHQVILLYNGIKQVLEMGTNTDAGVETKTEPLNNTPAARIVNLTEPNTIEVVLDQDLLDNSMQDTEDLMRQIKARPHITDGQPDGLMVYGMRPNTFFSHMGLKNGDIVKEINGSPVLSMDDIAKLYDSMEQATDTKLQISRRGRLIELVYTVKNDDQTNTPLSE